MMCKMRPDEAKIDGSLVGRLIENQFPHWADLPITAIPSPFIWPTRSWLRLRRSPTPSTVCGA